MKFVHISDLHLGKRLGEYSLLEDQEYILRSILDHIAAESPDAVLIAGDVYDKSSPSAEAVRLFDDFLYRLSALVSGVFIISGNHDSPERLSFGARIMDGSGVHLSPVWDGFVKPVTLTDELGAVDVYMLPFIKPVHAARYFPDAKIESYTDALAVAISAMNIDPDRRNVLLAHQFVTGASRCDSEEISVGGSDNVDVSAFDAFDYTALGHLHGPQQVGRPSVRYSGTPLKYSFSEARHEKSLTVVTLRDKGDVSVKTLPLTPLRDMRELRGSYMELTSPASYRDCDTNDYLHITLTDEDDIPDAVGRLRAIFKNIMKLDYDNTRTRRNNAITDIAAVEQKTPLELFSELYERQNNRSMSCEQRNYTAELIERIWEG